MVRGDTESKLEVEKGYENSKSVPSDVLLAPLTGDQLFKYPILLRGCIPFLNHHDSLSHTPSSILTSYPISLNIFCFVNLPRIIPPAFYSPSFESSMIPY